MTTRGLLHDRNFLIYLLGNTVSWLGTWAQRIGIGWLSWALTHSTAWVGVISLAQLLPLVFLGPLFGTLLDRHDRRRYALSVNGALSLLAAVLYLVTALNAMRIEVLFPMAVLLGIANSAYQAVRLSIVNDIVAPENLSAAIATNSLVYNVTRAVGPAIAGVLIAQFGIALAFGINALSFIGILVALLLVRLRPRERVQERGSLAADSLEGLRYVLRQGVLVHALLLSGVTSVFGRGIVELFPAYADAVFHRGIQGLADFTTAAGTGAVSGTLLLSRVRGGAALEQMTALATAALGVVVCLLGFSTTFPAAVLAAGLIGFLVVLCSVGLQVRLQTCVAEQFRGRALGLWIAINVAGPGLGGAASGYAAQLVGLRAVTLASGLLCVVCVAAIGLGSARRRQP